MRPPLAQRANRSAAQMRDLMAKLVRRRTADPGPDLLSAMIAAADEGERLRVRVRSPDRGLCHGGEQADIPL
jgi:cytochrome P450